jgi:hypothetical protein
MERRIEDLLSAQDRDDKRIQRILRNFDCHVTSGVPNVLVSIGLWH